MWLQVGSCELIKVLLTVISKAGNPWMCPHTCAHARLCNGARKKPQQYQNQEEHLLPLSMSLQRPLLTKLNIMFTARRNEYIVQSSISEQILKRKFGAERQ